MDRERLSIPCTVNNEIQCIYSQYTVLQITTKFFRPKILSVWHLDFPDSTVVEDVGINSEKEATIATVFAECLHRGHDASCKKYEKKMAVQA